MNKKLLVAVLVGLFALVGVPGAAFAEDCPDRTETNEQTNAEYLKKGIAFAEEALEHAKQGHAEETRTAAKSSAKALKCIVTTTAESQMQKPKDRVKMASIKAKKGDVEGAVPLLEEAIVMLNEVNMTPKGLGD